ncbi:MAG TPA: potassium channel family protein [Chloroflexia bacterium]|nr:potassium channel family protein [Chloroflexia bacterium]
MQILGGGLGLLLLFGILLDAFETVVLPRRITRRVRITTLFYRWTWTPWSALARRLPEPARENNLGFYGPLSLLLLLAVWALGLILSFALLQWALGSPLTAPEAVPTFGTDLYMSGTTFFTLGLGDVIPRTSWARGVAVVEAGIGFAFLGLVIGYLPVLYGAFSRRETIISLLDARAGSPPTAQEFVLRNGAADGAAAMGDFLRDWEQWAAELLESHLSYPVLAYFRSQHENQSWLGALTMILDSCALLMAAGSGPKIRPAQLTFAMARHVAVDLSQVFQTPPRPPDPDRLPAPQLAQLYATLAAAGVPLGPEPAVAAQLAALRASYEPYVAALAHYLLVTLPPWIPAAAAQDNWQTTLWDHRDGITLPNEKVGPPRRDPPV